MAILCRLVPLLLAVNINFINAFNVKITRTKQRYFKNVVDIEKELDNKRHRPIWLCQSSN